MCCVWNIGNWFNFDSWRNFLAFRLFETRKLFVLEFVVLMLTKNLKKNHHISVTVAVVFSVSCKTTELVFIIDLICVTEIYSRRLHTH